MKNENLSLKNLDSDWNASSSSLSEEDDNNNEDNSPYNLGKYMKPPNPLIEKGLYMNNEIKTGYKLNFIALPDFVSSQFHNTNDENKQKFQKAYQEDFLILNNDRNILFEYHPSKIGKTLFCLYPDDDDKRLIYKKFKKKRSLDIENKIYASLFIDLTKIMRGNKPSKVKDQEIELMTNEDNKELEPDTLVFNSMFESGNLFAVYKISHNEYDLILQNDTNSKGNTQWFFFSVSNTIKDSTIKFNIVNMMKPDSLFNYGMRPVVLSTIQNKQYGNGWQREGINISYVRNSISRESNTSQFVDNQTYYTLTFTYIFKHDNDIVYFAQCYPYTYSDLRNFLNNICMNNEFKHLINRKVLCKTLAQNDCEYLTITSNKNIDSIDNRYGIVFTARQHPGESLSSYMMQGIIEFLLEKTSEAEYLRSKCVFKIIPMLNPDGVIHGNYRTALSGTDLNRRWKKPRKVLYPTVYYAKQLIKKLKNERDVQLVLDLHGHSRKKNCFIYGCTDLKNPLNSRLFPYILSKISTSFSFKDSRFTIQKSKESTARVSLWKELKIPNVFTLEASFYGYESDNCVYGYTKQDYLNIGREICKALHVYLNQLPSVDATSIQKNNLKVNRENTCIENKVKGVITGGGGGGVASADSLDWMEELKSNKELIELGNQLDDSGSDGNPSQDELQSEEMMIICSKKKGNKKHKNEKKSAFNLRINRKLEKSHTITTATTTNNLDDLKKAKNKPLDKILNIKNTQNKRISNIPDIIISSLSIANPIEMIDKETQTEEIYFEINDLEDKGHFIIENQISSNDIGQKPLYLTQNISGIPKNKTSRLVLDANIGLSITNQSSNFLYNNLIQQFPNQKIQNDGQKIKKNIQNLKNTIQKYTPGHLDQKKLIIDGINATGNTMVLSTKKKLTIGRNTNNACLSIKANLKDLKIASNEEDNLQQTIRSTTASILDHRKSSSCRGEQSAISQKALPSPRVIPESRTNPATPVIFQDNGINNMQMGSPVNRQTSSLISKIMEKEQSKDFNNINSSKLQNNSNTRVFGIPYEDRLIGIASEERLNSLKGFKNIQKITSNSGVKNIDIMISDSKKKQCVQSLYFHPQSMAYELNNIHNNNNNTTTPSNTNTNTNKYGLIIEDSNEAKSNNNASLKNIPDYSMIPNSVFQYKNEKKLMNGMMKIENEETCNNNIKIKEKKSEFLKIELDPIGLIINPNKDKKMKSIALNKNVKTLGKNNQLTN